MFRMDRWRWFWVCSALMQNYLVLCCIVGSGGHHRLHVHHSAVSLKPGKVRKTACLLRCSAGKTHFLPFSWMFICHLPSTSTFLDTVTSPQMETALYSSSLPQSDRTQSTWLRCSLNFLTPPHTNLMYLWVAGPIHREPSHTLKHLLVQSLQDSLRCSFSTLVLVFIRS